MGNSIGTFNEGELYLVGSHLPHLFKNEIITDEKAGNDSNADFIVVQFTPDFLGKEFYGFPETVRLKELFEKANMGLIFNGLESCLEGYMLKIVNGEGLSVLVNILAVLDFISNSDNFTVLCSPRTTYPTIIKEKERMAQIISYLTENFEHKIELNEISNIANMAPNSFCRFFKNHTNKTFSRYLNEIRVGNACLKLIENNRQISSIATEVGFNSITNFNRQFKSILGVTPKEYLNKYRIVQK